MTTNTKMDKENAYKNLAAEIVNKAVTNYKRALEDIKKESQAKRPRNEKREIETFFRSQWFERLSDLDGERVINKLNE